MNGKSWADLIGLGTFLSSLHYRAVVVTWLSCFGLILMHFIRRRPELCSLALKVGWRLPGDLLDQIFPFRGVPPGPGPLARAPGPRPRTRGPGPWPRALAPAPRPRGGGRAP